MTSDPGRAIPLGWQGGCAESNPVLGRPDPDLSSLPLLDNMANIDLLQWHRRCCGPSSAGRP